MKIILRYSHHVLVIWSLRQSCLFYPTKLFKDLNWRKNPELLDSLHSRCDFRLSVFSLWHCFLFLLWCCFLSHFDSHFDILWHSLTLIYFLTLAPISSGKERPNSKARKKIWPEEKKFPLHFFFLIDYLLSYPCPSFPAAPSMMSVILSLNGEGQAHGGAI